MPERPRIVVIGAGGHGKVVVDILRAAGRYEVAGFVDPTAATEVSGVPILGDDAVLPALRAQGIEAAFIAIGDNRRRATLAARLAAMGYDLPAAVHPAAIVSATAVIGHATLVAPLGIINADVRVGDCVIVNSGAIVEHDCVVDTAAHVAPGCALAGHVRIGARTLVGIGTVVRPGVSIGGDVVIGAGSVVVSDIPDGVTVFGVPARVRQGL